MNPKEVWPELEFEQWKDTCQTLHMWTQIVGKVRLAQTPWINHSWHVTLYVTARGLTTSPFSCGERILEIEFDFVDQRLSILTGGGERRHVPLKPQPVRDFYRAVMAALKELGCEPKFSTLPNEIPDAIRFEEDEKHCAYDPEYANRFWRILLQTQRVFTEFRSHFIGKCSPMHFFWGSFDLAVTRFSGRPAPSHPGGIPNLPDRITREAYSHEVSSAGFWPGSSSMREAIFYSYSYPIPEGFAGAKVRPEGAYFSAAMREFVFPYAAMRNAASPDEALLEFLQTTYEAAAVLGKWDRTQLERGNGPLPSAAHSR